MSEPTQFGPAVDYAHFFARVLQIGVEQDVEQCSAMLLGTYGTEISRVWARASGRVHNLETLRRAVLAEQGEEAAPQLERVAGLLLDVGPDLPLLHLAGLLRVTAEREPYIDPWFVHRGIDEAHRLSYVRRLHTENGSEGHVEFLARTFTLDPVELLESLVPLLAARLAEADAAWGHLEGNLGRANQVEIDAYWDGFISADVRAGDADGFESALAQLFQIFAGSVPRSIPNIGMSMGEAVDREGSRRIRQP